MSDEIEGGCFCGETRYKIRGEPVFQLYCFCKDCLAITGTDGYAGYMVKEFDFKLTKGKPSTHATSPFIRFTGINIELSFL